MRHEYLSERVSFQQTVDANVNFNAREGRSTVEVCKQLIILLRMFFRGNMLEQLPNLFPSLPPFKQSILLSVQF